MEIQGLRGSTGAKQVLLTDNFVGGINLTYNDDVVSEKEFRQLQNFNIDNRGSLDKRKGFGFNEPLSQLLLSGVTSVEQLPFVAYDGSSTYKEIVYFKVVRDDNNAWREIDLAESLDTYQLEHGLENNTVKLVSICKKENGALVCLFNEYTIGTDTITTNHASVDLKGTNSVENCLMSVESIISFNKIYFTSQDGGLIVIDFDTNSVQYCGDFGDEENKSYKPNALEVRKVGFNVLGDSPLTWVDGSSITTESIQGMYITTLEGIPVTRIPTGSKFYINVLFTGEKSDFSFEFKIDADRKVSATCTKNNELSTGSLAIYEIDFTSQPTSEIEITIKFSDEDVIIDPYIDYYEIGQIDPNAKPITKLNVGNFKLIEMDSRLVFYKGDTIWFSEIARYDYIPNYNYIILNIDKDDEIMRISFFRTSYIVFTKKKIFKLSGTFGMSDFAVSLVNGNIGCIASNSVCMVNNELYFLSNLGIRSLKLDQFRENLENINELDGKIKPLVVGSEHSVGFAYEDTYILFKNNRELDKATFNYREYDVPDTLKYYYNLKAYVGATYSIHPRFLFSKNNLMYSLYSADNTLENFKVCNYNSGYTDFGKSYEVKFETAGINFTTPLHQKKIKDIILKCGGGTVEQPIYLTVRADGYLVYDNSISALKVDEQGTIHYEVTQEPSLVLPPAQQEQFNNFKLSNSKFGISSFYVRKMRVPTKCKNLAIIVSSTVDTQYSISAIGYVFKVGKIKE